MEDPKILVFDISSDEDSGNGCGGGDSTIDFKWIKKLLDVDDDDNEEKGFKDCGERDDSDELLVVDEVCANRKQIILKSCSGAGKGFLKGSDGDSDDDDCIVLDCDPDKPTAVEEKKGGSEGGVGDDSDDLVVVSEKGEVACRDFPHSRHLCAKFPFSSSEHKMHCDQCHCYVCESLAPCLDWGTGVFSVDHCNATDKEAFWISQRSYSRSVRVSMPIDVPAMDISMRRHPIANQSSPLVPNLVEHNQVPRQFTVRPCSTLANSGVPNIIRKGPSPGFALHLRRYQPHLISKHLADTSPHVLTDRRHNNSNIPPQQAVFKRIDPSRSTLSSGRTGLNQSCPHYGARLSSNHAATPRWQGSHGGTSSASHAYQSSVADMLSPQIDPVPGNGFSDTMPPPQMLSQQNRGSGNGNDILLQPQMVAQQHISPEYTNYMPQTSSHLPVHNLYENPVLSQQLASLRLPGNGIFNPPFVSEPQTNYQPDMGYGFMNTTHTPPQLTGLTQQNEGRPIEYSEPTQSQSLRQFEAESESLQVPSSNVVSSSIDPFLPYPSPEYNQPLIISNSHNRLQQRNQTILEVLGSNVAVSDYCPVSCTSPSTLLGCNSQPQNAELTDHYSANTNFHHQYPSPTDFGTTDLEAWLSVDRSVPNAPEISFPPLLNTPIPSPELASLDGGLFFD